MRASKILSLVLHADPILKLLNGQLSSPKPSASATQDNIQMQIVQVALDYVIFIDPGATKNLTLKRNSQGKFPWKQRKVWTSEEPPGNLLPTSTRAFSSPD